VLATTALVAFFAPAAPLTGLWLGLTVVSITAAALVRALDGARQARVWRAVLAVLVLALALLYVGRAIL
jgi:hypothetical protein